MDAFSITPTASGKYKVTWNLRSLWLTEAEAHAAATDPKAAAAVLRRLQESAR